MEVEEMMEKLCELRLNEDLDGFLHSASDFLDALLAQRKEIVTRVTPYVPNLFNKLMQIEASICGLMHLERLEIERFLAKNKETIDENS